MWCGREKWEDECERQEAEREDVDGNSSSPKIELARKNRLSAEAFAQNACDGYNVGPN